MNRPRLEIGRSLRLDVQWYDRVSEPEKSASYEGEVVGWRNTQVIVRVRDYAVLRFWKKSGLEVGNLDHSRRGFRINWAELEASLHAPPGVAVELSADGANT